MTNAKVILEKTPDGTSCQMQGAPIEILSLLLCGIAGLYNSQEGTDRDAIRAGTVAAVLDPKSLVWDDTPCDDGLSISIRIPRKEDEE